MSEPAAPRPPVVAVIDDEEDVTTFLRMVLEDNGYRVVATTEAARALELIEEAKPDLICLDLLMPEQTGLALYAAISRHPELATVPVIILSGLAVTDDLLQMVWNTGDLPAPVSFVEKPVDAERLLRTVRGVLGRQVGVAP